MDLLKYVQWATLVTTFSGPTLFTKMPIQTFPMLIKLVTFYLIDDIQNISESLMRIILLRQEQLWQKCTCNLNVYIFH